MFERALSACQDANIPLFLPVVVSGLVAVHALAGQFTEVPPLLEQVVKLTTARRPTTSYALYIARVSEAYMLAGRLEPATQLAWRALEIAREHNARGHAAKIH